MSWYYLGLELKRQIKQPMTLFFCGLMPVLFYLLFGSMPGMDQASGRGNANAMVVLFMSVYGAIMTATMSANSVSFERPLGWNRELRLTPLRPWAYIATKIINALLGSVLSMAVLYIVALAMGKAQMPAWMWLAGLGIGLVCGITFGALSLFFGSILPGQTAIGVMIPILLVCCFLAGIFSIPMMGTFFAATQKIVPLGGAANLILAMFGPNVSASGIDGGMAVGDWRIWANIIGWLVVFLVAGSIAYARDTKRQ